MVTVTGYFEGTLLAHRVLDQSALADESGADVLGWVGRMEYPRNAVAL